MATAGEGATSSYEGGAGGKFRKKPFRRPQTTPYDRPPTAPRNPSRNGWFTKVVEPASKFITASAHRLFSSVVRKRLPPPPQPPLPPEAKQEPRDRLQEAVPNNCIGASESAIGEAGKLNQRSDGSGISELEQMLKQKTFTRSEIDCLTKLLHSRTVELPVGDEDKRTESNLSKPPLDIERREGFTSNPMQENRNEIISTPVVSSTFLEADIASPAELAKAYMGGRPSKVSPSMLGLRSQALRKDTPFLNNMPFPAKSPILSLASKTAVRVGVPENGFITPKSRGRSAIYSMARTPYSRVHPTVTQKGSGSTSYGYGGPSSSSQGAWEHDGQLGSKQLALKRRSSVLDDDIGSVGAIRRIRQKPNLSYQGSRLSTRGMGVGYDAPQHCLSPTQKLLLIDEAKHKVSKTVEENGDNSIPSTSYAPVPSKSSETAARILQHLENLTPKEKSAESKLGIALREKSPAKLTPNMLRGQALRSLEDVDSPKFLQNAQDRCKPEDLRNDWLPDARDSTSQSQNKVEENGPKRNSIHHDMLTSSMNVDIAVSMKDTAPSVKTAGSISSKFAAQPPQKKRAFQMSAHEDYLELDDDIHTNGLASTPSTEGREKPETYVVESKFVSTEAISLAKTPALPEVKNPVGSILSERTDLETSGGSVVGEENTRFTFPTSPAPSTTFQQAVVTQSTSAFEKIAAPKDPSPPPLFNLRSKNVDKVPPFTFSSSPSADESSFPKSGFRSDPKQESSNSLANVTLGTTDAQLKILESDKGDYKNTQKAGDIMGTLPSPASTSMSTSAIFAFGAPAKNSNLNNGSLSSSHPIFPSPVLASSNFSNQNFNNSSIHVPSSTSTATLVSTGTATTTASNSGLSSSAAAPTFNFGSSLAQSAPVSTVSTSYGSETTDMIAKTQKETSFGNVTSSPFSGPSFAMASTGSSVFGFSSSFTSSTVNNQSRGSPFATGSGSLVSAQVPPPGTGVATVTQSLPTQFSSSASSPVFRTSGITSFSSGSSIFGSSNPADKQFGSGTSFGVSSSTSPSETKSVSSSSVAASSIFGSSWQSTKSPVFGSTFSSPSPSSGFSFGASSTSVAATNSGSMVFGSSTVASSGSMFSFASAAATTSSLPSLSQPQPVFGNTTVFTATSTNSDQMNMEDSMAEDTVQASTPAVPLFGQQPVSLPPAGFMFGSTAPLPAVPFQFSGQQNQGTPVNPSLFQASNSLDFSAGGSFSLGSGGGDKSNRKIVRINKNRSRKK